MRAVNFGGANGIMYDRDGVPEMPVKVGDDELSMTTVWVLDDEDRAKVAAGGALSVTLTHSRAGGPSVAVRTHRLSPEGKRPWYREPMTQTDARGGPIGPNCERGRVCPE